MRLLLNIIWLVFGGLVLAFGYAVAALVMFILIITIPFGVARRGWRCTASGRSAARW